MEHEFYVVPEQYLRDEKFDMKMCVGLMGCVHCGVFILPTTTVDLRGYDTCEAFFSATNGNWAPGSSKYPFQPRYGGDPRLIGSGGGTITESPTDIPGITEGDISWEKHKEFMRGL